MDIFISDQLRAMMFAFIVGLFLAFLYDILRFSRIVIGLENGNVPKNILFGKLPFVDTDICKRIIPEKLDGIIVFIGDIIYFTVVTFVYNVFLFHANNGDSRGFLTFSAIIGFTVWFNTFGRLFLRVSGFFKILLFSLIRYIVLTVGFPVRLAGKYFIVPLHHHFKLKILLNNTEKTMNRLANELELWYN